MLLSTKNSTWPYLFRYFAQQMMFISIFRVAQIKASNGQNWAFDFVQLASIFRFFAPLRRNHLTMESFSNLIRFESFHSGREHASNSSAHSIHLHWTKFSNHLLNLSKCEIDLNCCILILDRIFGSIQFWPFTYFALCLDLAWFTSYPYQQ